MAKASVGCIDCHMPSAGLLAESRPDSLHGDLRSHLFVIKPSTAIPRRSSGGASYNPGFLTVDYACMPCHDVFESRQWALAYGLIGFFLYSGKVWAVRYKKIGWTAAGAFLGVGLFLFWLVQIATIFIKERGF